MQYPTVACMTITEWNKDGPTVNEDATKPWEQHPIRTLHACVEMLASTLKGYLPWPDQLRGSRERSIEALIEDTLKRADACMVIIEHGEEQRRLSTPSEMASSGWIPVRERLPEQRIRVLGYNGLAIEDCFYGVSSDRSDADWSEVTWRRTAYEDHFRATHWMPLPGAPK